MYVSGCPQSPSSPKLYCTKHWLPQLELKLSWAIVITVTSLSVCMQARIQDFWKGGGGVQARIQDFSQAPPPLGHCPRDVIRPQKIWKTPPLLDIHKHTHTLGHWPCAVIHIPRGGAGWSPLSHTHPGSATGVHLRSTSKKGGAQLCAQC